MQQVRLAVQQREAARGKGAVACGDRHSLVRSEAGSVWSFGNGEYGRLGHGSESNELVPRLIAPLEKVQVVAVAAGKGYSMALSSDGEVYVWGAMGQSGAIGLGEPTPQTDPHYRMHSNATLCAELH